MPNRTNKYNLIETAKILLVIAEKLNGDGRHDEAILIYRKAAIHGLLVRALTEQEGERD